MRGPKVVLIGASSAFFGRQTIWSMVSKEALRGGTLALADVEEPLLGTMAKIARRAIDATKAPLKLEISTDYRKLLKGADFVTLAFAKEGVRLRGVDSAVSTKHGMTTCSGDTIGPGGTFRTLREVPRQSAMLKEVTRRCPDAWVINWVNPTAAMGIAMMRHFPRLKSLAICDGPHAPYIENWLIKHAGLAKTDADVTPALRSRLRLRIGGVNHFNWLLEMSLGGKDLVPKVRDSLRRSVPQEAPVGTPQHKQHVCAMIELQLLDVFGYLPMCAWHTEEYLPYFQGRDIHRKRALAIRPWSVQERWKWMREQWADMRALASGRRTMADFLARTRGDHASDIIESSWAGTRKHFYINTANRGAVPNMAADAFLELPCVVDMNEVRPLPFGPMPRPLLGFCQHVLDEHELAVEAAVTCDKAILRRALATSMVATSIPDVEACMEELLRRERPYLPKAWYR